MAVIDGSAVDVSPGLVGLPAGGSVPALLDGVPGPVGSVVAVGSGSGVVAVAVGWGGSVIVVGGAFTGGGGSGPSLVESWDDTSATPAGGPKSDVVGPVRWADGCWAGGAPTAGSTGADDPDADEGFEEKPPGSSPDELGVITAVPGRLAVVSDAGVGQLTATTTPIVAMTSSDAAAAATGRPRRGDPAAGGSPPRYPGASGPTGPLSLIHILEPTRHLSISYAGLCL